MINKEMESYNRIVSNTRRPLTLIVGKPLSQEELMTLIVNEEPIFQMWDKDGNDIDTGEKRLYAPLVVFVKNGKIVGSHEGTVPTHIEGNLSTEEREELYNIYKKNIDDIYKSNYCDKESEC